jgi:hypothetical protein
MEERHDGNTFQKLAQTRHPCRGHLSQTTLGAIGSDAFQRGVLFLDVMRQRSGIARNTLPGRRLTCKFGAELIMDGADLAASGELRSGPVTPPAGIEINENKRPFRRR